MALYKSVYYLLLLFIYLFGLDRLMSQFASYASICNHRLAWFLCDSWRSCRVLYCSETGTAIILENSGGPLGIHVVPGVDKFGR